MYGIKVTAYAAVVLGGVLSDNGSIEKAFNSHLIPFTIQYN